MKGRCKFLERVVGDDILTSNVTELEECSECPDDIYNNKSFDHIQVDLCVRNRYFTNILNFYFSAQLPHFCSLKSLFSQPLIIETRQNESIGNTSTWCYQSVAVVLVSTLLVPPHCPLMLVQLPEVLQLFIECHLSHLSGNGLCISEFPPLRQPVSPLVELDLMKILDDTLEMNQNRCHPIRVDHQVGYTGGRGGFTQWVN